MGNGERRSVQHQIRSVETVANVTGFRLKLWKEDLHHFLFPSVVQFLKYGCNFRAPRKYIGGSKLVIAHNTVRWTVCVIHFGCSYSNLASSGSQVELPQAAQTYMPLRPVEASFGDRGESTEVIHRGCRLWLTSWRDTAGGETCSRERQIMTVVSSSWTLFA